MPWRSEKAALWAACAVLLILTHVYVLNAYPEWKNPNSASRVYLTLAVVDDGSLRIDGPLRRYSDIQDKALSAGRYYSDKAPAYSLLLVPIAWVLRQTFIPVENFGAMLVWLRVLGLSLPAVAFWLLVVPFYAEIAGSWRRGVAVMLVGALGTNFFIYATRLFAHAMAGMLLFASLLAARRALVDGAVAWRRVTWCAAAGALAGLAFTTDYVVVLAVPVVLGYAMLGSKFDWRRTAGLAAGLAPVLLLWMAYNYACFDHPLSVGFHHHTDEVYGEAYQTGLWGVQVPSWEAVAGMTFSAARGLFFLSPVLVLCPVGWGWLWGETKHRSLAVSSLLVFVGVLLFAATTVDWRGGWAVGSRYLVPAVPFLLVGLAGSLRAARPNGVLVAAFCSLAVPGFILVAIAEATYPFFPTVFRNPLFSFALPLLRGGYVSPNIVSVTAGEGLLSVVPFFGVMALAMELTIWTAVEGGLRPRLRVGSVAGAAGLAVILLQGQIPEPVGGADVRAVSRAIALRNMGYTETAIADLRDAVRAHRGSIVANQSLAELLVRQGELAEAVPYYEKIVQMKPGSAEARYVLGTVLFQLGRFDAAAEQFAVVLRVRPELLSAMANLASAREAQGRLDEAARYYAAALRRRPAWPEVQFRLGVVLARQRKWAQAAVQLKAVVQARPRSAAAHCELAGVLAEQGQIEEAAAHYQTALQIQSDYAEAREGLQRLRDTAPLHAPGADGR